MRESDRLRRQAAAKRRKRQKSDEWLGKANVASPSFLKSYEWRKLRMEAIKKYGARCMCCGATPEHGVVINVDHIKPRLLFPSLALKMSNLQILCGDCNHGKANWDMTDWRPKASSEESGEEDVVLPDWMADGQQRVLG